MPNKNHHIFESLCPQTTKYETRLARYLINVKDAKNDRYLPNKKLALQDPNVSIHWPQISINDFLNEKELQVLKQLKRKRDIRDFLEKHIPETYKGPARIVLKELMYNVNKYISHKKFSPKQSGAIFSLFFLTHSMFTSLPSVGAEKLYIYFKELLFCHSVSNPPDSIKIFSVLEGEDILNYFWKTYLRYLPLIRTLCCPNFAFYLEYEIEPDSPLLAKPKKGKGKDKGEKKPKGEKKDKKKKK